MKDLLRKFLTIAVVLSVLAVPAAGIAADASTTMAYLEPTTGLHRFIITWSAATGAAAVSSLAFAVPEPCYFVSGWTNPGATAPTDNYDITIANSDGADLFALALNNRDTANSEIAAPTSPGGGLAYGTVTFSLANNSVNAALGTTTLWCVGD